MDTLTYTIDGVEVSFRRVNGGLLTDKKARQEACTEVIGSVILVLWTMVVPIEVYTFRICSNDPKEAGAATVECLDENWLGERCKLRLYTKKQNVFFAFEEVDEDDEDEDVDEDTEDEVYAKKQKVEVLDRGTWYKATVLKVDDHKGVLVHYKGYKPSQDKYVQRNVLRAGWSD